MVKSAGSEAMGRAMKRIRPAPMGRAFRLCAASTPGNRARNQPNGARGPVSAKKRRGARKAWARTPPATKAKQKGRQKKKGCRQEATAKK